VSKLVFCSPPSRSRRLRLGLCQRKRFSQKRFRLRFRGVHEHPAVRRGTKQLKTVATRVIAATEVFYFARGIGSQASVGAAVDEEHWVEETACKRKRIETSLICVTIMLHVLTYFVSNKLFWN